MKETAIIIQTTTNEKHIALKLTKILLELKKAACVQISEIDSHYYWNGQISNHKEFLLTVKSIKSLSADIFGVIKHNHNYSLPEIIQISVDECTTEYIAWMIKETNQPVAH